MLNEGATHQGDHQRGRSDGGVGGEAGVDQLGEPFAVIGSGVGRNVANDGRANTEIEQAVVARNREDQNPNPECRVAQPMQDEGREENSHQDTDSEAEPTGADIFEDFPVTHRLLGPQA